MYGSPLAEAAAATGDPEWADAAVAIGQFLCDHLLGRRRSVAEELATRRGCAASCLRQRLRLAGRLLHAAGRAHRRGCWTERAVDTADAAHRPLPRQRGRGLLHHRPRRRAAHRADQGHLRRRHPVGRTRWRPCPGPARRPHRRRALHCDRPGGRRPGGDLLVRHPTAFAHTVLAADLLMEGWTEVVITGDRPDLLEVVREAAWLPGAVLAWGEPTALPAWQDRALRPGLCLPATTACQLPTDDARTILVPGSWPRAPVSERIDPNAPRAGTARRRRPLRSSRCRGSRWPAGRHSTVLVLSCHREDTIGVDLASGTLVRVRVAWPEDHGPDLAPFDVVEARSGRRARAGRPRPARGGHRRPGSPATSGPSTADGSAACSTSWPRPVEEHVLGFPGASAPLLGVPRLPARRWPWSSPTKGPVLFRRDRRPVGVDPVRMGPKRQLAAGRGPPGRAGPGRRPPRPPPREGPGVGPGVQAPLPGGVGHHAAGRPLLQDRPGHAPT